LDGYTLTCIACSDQDQQLHSQELLFDSSPIHRRFIAAD
jgi:hypothetical protein